ncbi:MAG TPA: hypothetical protein VIL16_14895 [Trebonia sp.]
MSNLIDFDLMVDESDEPEGADEAKKAASELEEVRPAERMSIRARSDLRLPHPPGPVGMDIPRTRLWIKHPPGPVGF